MRIYSFMIFLVSVLLVPLLAGESKEVCLVKPDHLSMEFPELGHINLHCEHFDCIPDDTLKKKWIRKSSGDVDLFLFLEGPSGSGRFWNVTIGIADKNKSKPDRTICLITSTVGWRTLQGYNDIPLPWLDDLDGDGKAEFIVWDSFPLHEYASMASYGLVAWVYRLESNRTLVINWDLSRRMALSIAEEYRKEKSSLKSNRVIAANALKNFAKKRCKVTNNKKKGSIIKKKTL
ncbi:MAG: hypothetical protein GY714_26600 [Desulfobacterales bacterium]|nr:hypothetical protein [Desulfobacterales bacterium]MCP4159462.1 hypothetical protein [Deltaproteobacteria bacterium]